MHQPSRHSIQSGRRFRFHLFRLAVVLSTALIALQSAIAAPLSFHVSTQGDDANPGTQAAPFRTLERARDAIRSSSGRTEPGQTQLPAGWEGAAVTIHAGTYHLESTLLFDSRDAGTESSPIVYQANTGEMVVISGAIPIPVGAWKHVVDPYVRARLQPQVRNQVRQTSLRSLGIKALQELGTPGARKDLYVDGLPMDLARWPDAGWTEVASLGGNSTQGILLLDGDRMDDWSESSHIWLHGYWRDDSSDAWQQFADFDDVTNTLTLAQPWSASGYGAGQWFRAYNVLEELDQPGEWYLDVDLLQLLCIPRSGGIVGNASLPEVENVIHADGANWTAFNDVTIEGSLSHGVVFSNTVGASINDSTVRNTGGWGVRFEGGSRGQLVNVEISATGEGGVFLDGGNRNTLQPGGHVINTVHIHDFARFHHTGQPAVFLAGVGNTVTNSLIENGPQSGVQFSGNNHVIENSILRMLCLESGAAGAVFSGGDWTWRGTRVSGNTFEDILQQGIPAGGSATSTPAAVHLGVGLSSTTVENNTFTRCGYGILIDGGRDNVVAGNEFSECQTPIYLDSILGRVGVDAALQAGLDAVPYQNATWSGAYPELSGILSGQPKDPENNQFNHNRAMDMNWLLDASLGAQPFVQTGELNYAPNGTETPLDDLLAYNQTVPPPPPTPPPPPPPIPPPAPPPTGTGLVYFVATNGSDANSGTEAAPFATITKARDAIRAATGRTSNGGSPGSSWDGATIYLRGGTYYISSLLTFDNRDQGTAAHPYVVSAYPSESVRVTGATAISNNSWARADGDGGFGASRLPDPAGTYYISWNSGDLRPDEAALLLDDGQLIKYSTYPNGATIQSAGSWLGIKNVSDSGSKQPTSFDCDDDTIPGGWNEADQDIICFGVLGEDWSSSWNDVSSLSVAGSGSRVVIDSRRGPYATHENQFMRFWNVMEALTAGTAVHAEKMGRYYYKTSNGSAPTNVDIATMDTIIRLGVDGGSGADYLTFQNITFDGCRDKAIQMFNQTGGGFVGCTIGPNGNTGLYIKNCRNVSFANGLLKDNVQFGIVWDSCGDKSTLTPSGCSMTGTTSTGNSWGSDGQGNQSVRLQGAGCGFLAEGNTFVGNYSGDFAQDAAGGWPYVVVNDNDFIGGNLMLSDIGACYMGRSLSAPGCEITNNRFTDVTVNKAPGSGWIYGVYLDDCFSWATVTDNVFDNCDQAMQLASGKGLVVRRNKFTDCNGGHDGAPVLLANRNGFATVKSTIEADLAIYANLPAFVAANPNIQDFKAGGSKNSMILRFWNSAGTGITFVDNMNTESANTVRIPGSPASGDINLDQLNYPLGSSGTPTNGGGTAKLSTIYHQTP